MYVDYDTTIIQVSSSSPVLLFDYVLNINTAPVYEKVYLSELKSEKSTKLIL